MIGDRGKTEGAGIPAFAQGYAQFVLSLAKILYGIGLILQALVIARPAGSEIGVVRLLAVHFRLIETQRGGVEPCFANGFGDGEGFCEDRACGIFLIQPVRDPAGFALKGSAGEKAGLKRGVGFRALSMIVPHGDGPGVGGTGLEQRAHVLDEDALFARNFAGVPHHLAIRNGQAVGGLAGILPVALQLPAEAGLHLVEPDGVGFIFDR